MPLTSNLAITASDTLPAAGPCTPLFEVATPTVFVNNAFRISGLPVDASPTEIAKRFEALKRWDGLSGEPPATLEQLRDAERRLQSPEHRLIDEIFWFWPVTESGSKSDPALNAVAAGDYTTAKNIWRNLITHPKLGAAALHNLAIRWHIAALSLEAQWRPETSSDKAIETLSKCWLYALRRWDLLVRDDRLWAHIDQRIRAVDDYRISPSLTWQWRQAFPWALASINAALTVAHARARESSLVAMHVGLFRDGRLLLPSGQFADMVRQRAKVAEPHRGSGSGKAVAALSGSDKSPAQRYAAFKDDVLPRLVTIMADQSLSEEARIAASDAAAQALRTVSVDAWTKAKDATTASAALRDAMQYATGDTLKNLYEDFKILNEMLTEQRAAEPNRPIVDAAWRAGPVILGALAFIVTLQLLSREIRGSYTSSRTLPPHVSVPDSPKPLAADTPAHTAQATEKFRIAKSTARELDGEQRVIAEQKQIAQQLENQYREASSLLHEQESEANNLEQQLHEQSRQNNRERSFVDPSDPNSIEYSHSKEDHYKNLVKQATTARAAADALVDPLNTLGQRVSAQNALVNRLVDSYSAKDPHVDR